MPNKYISLGAKALTLGLTLSAITAGFAFAPKVNVAAATPNKCDMLGEAVNSTYSFPAGSEGGVYYPAGSYNVRNFTLTDCVTGGLKYIFPWNNGSNIPVSNNEVILGAVDIDGNGTKDLISYDSTFSNTYLMSRRVDTNGAYIQPRDNSGQPNGGFDEVLDFLPGYSSGVNYNGNWKPVAVGDFQVSYSNGTTTWISKAAVVAVNQATGEVALDPIECVTTSQGGNYCSVIPTTGFNNNGTFWSGRKILNVGVGAAAAPFWKVGGVGDFNGDSKLDIAWRNNVTGENAVWMLTGSNNSTLLSSHILYQTIADQNWKMVGAGEVTGDNKDDIMWYYGPTNATYYWGMNGHNLVSSVQATTSGSIVANTKRVATGN